jgi:hypothetical protein
LAAEKRLRDTSKELICAVSEQSDQQDAANGAIGDQEGFDQWFETRGVWPRLTYLEIWQASRAALTAANGAIGEREAFEHWITTEGGYDPVDMVTHQDGEVYVLAAVHEAWEAWQGRDALTAETVAGQSVDEIRRAVWRKAYSVCLEGVKWTPEPSKEAQFYIKGTCHRLAAEISSRAGLIDGKVAGQEPVGEVTATVLEGADQGVIGWYGDPLPVNSLLYTTPQHPAQSAELPDPSNIQGWSVTVNVNAQNILIIGHNSLSGIDNIEDFAPVVRNCAEHLISFIGVERAQSAEQDERAVFVPYYEGVEICQKCKATRPESTATQPAVGWFVQRSKFGPWVEVEQQEPGAEQFYRIAAQPVSGGEA